MSPLTEMATKFHSRNGAKLLQVNETTQNFDNLKTSINLHKIQKLNK